MPKPRIARGHPRGDPGPAGRPACRCLVEQLRSADKACFALGLRVARELPGREVTDAWWPSWTGRAGPAGPA